MEFLARGKIVFVETEGQAIGFWERHKYIKNSRNQELKIMSSND